MASRLQTNLDHVDAREFFARTVLHDALLFSAARITRIPMAMRSGARRSEHMCAAPSSRDTHRRRADACSLTESCVLLRYVSLFYNELSLKSQPGHRQTQLSTKHRVRDV